jgi:hypothetical protein
MGIKLKANFNIKKNYLISTEIKVSCQILIKKIKLQKMETKAHKTY